MGRGTLEGELGGEFAVYSAGEMNAYTVSASQQYGRALAY